MEIKKAEARNFTERYLCFFPRFKYIECYICDDDTSGCSKWRGEPLPYSNMWIIGGKCALPDRIENFQPDNLKRNASVHLLCEDKKYVYPSEKIQEILRIGKLENDCNSMTEALRSFCSNEGLPMVEVFGFEKPYHCFSVRKFLNEVHHLRDIAEYLSGVSDGYSPSLVIDGRTIASLQADASIQLDITEEKRELVYSCHDLLDTLHIWMIYKVYSDDAKIHICNECGIPYIPSKSTQRYCSYCGDSTHRSQRKRKRDAQERKEGE